MCFRNADEGRNAVCCRGKKCASANLLAAKVKKPDPTAASSTRRRAEFNRLKQNLIRILLRERILGTRQEKEQAQNRGLFVSRSLDEFHTAII